MPPHRIKTISYQTFQDALSRYPSTVPANLRTLDTQRYDAIPARALHGGQQDSGDSGSAAALTKDMVETLVEWKLCVSIEQEEESMMLLY